MSLYRRRKRSSDRIYGRIFWLNGYACTPEPQCILPHWGLCACCGEYEIPAMLPEFCWCEGCEKTHWMMIAKKIGWTELIPSSILLGEMQTDTGLLPFLMRDRVKAQRRMQLYRYLLDERPTTPQDNRPLWYLGGLEIWGLEESFHDVV